VTVLFCLPQTRPAGGGLVSVETFNYAPVALLVVLAMAWAWWRRQGSSYEVPAQNFDRSAATYEDEVV
jgi:hypothetical protein